MPSMAIYFGRHDLEDYGDRVVFFVRGCPYWDRFRTWNSTVSLVPWGPADIRPAINIRDGGKGFAIARGVFLAQGPIAPLLDYLMEICDHPDLPRIVARIMEDAG